jgi:hypothetical protein
MLQRCRRLEVMLIVGLRRRRLLLLITLLRLMPLLLPLL